ncbi:acyltransferase [Actinoplanes sp. OR16]|uniref:acyltransferase family protein n=1 Tax=Actinoplanes sp. OR16 TaxID=946334 RepID=UPI000F6BBB8A|nr:acyltransferase family protein [Actinoplanes sp. OR16]BBH67755.1 acyltransferase [Actinoplanes sp. OR16]
MVTVLNQTAPPAVTPAAARKPAAREGFRPDIEGLRAIAVTIVVLFHAGLPVIEGGYIGVDVFFVISGFLITGHLLRELDRSGKISLLTFYARRSLRLLPAASFVVVSTMAVCWLWLPPLQVRSIATDALTTTFYGMNYRLAIEGTDYLGATAAPSPLQHFWSLAVEEQFYLFWPALLVLLAWTCRRRTPDQRRRAVLIVLLLGIGVSFALSVWQTGVSAPWAYFGIHTRAWELALGGVVAIAAPLLTRLRPPAVRAGRWLGLGGIGASAVLYTEATPFPGYAAALPALATAMVIIAGCTDASSPGLGCAPMQAIGKLSYSWYLWHWPVLIVGPFALGDINVMEGVTLAGLSLILAVVTARQLEDPLRNNPWLRSNPRRALAFGFALSAGVASLSLLMPSILPRTTGTGSATDAAGALSATSEAERNLIKLIETSSENDTVPANLKPTVSDAAKDVGRIYADGCDPKFLETDVKKPCFYGDRKAKRTMVLLGDSHAGHWFPALEQIATKQKWRLAVVTKSACPAALATVTLPAMNRPFTECDAWRTAAFAYIKSLQPALIVTSSNSHSEALDVSGSQADAWADAWAKTVEQLRQAGKVAFISDTAWPDGNVPECVSNHISDVSACNRDRDAAFGDLHRRKAIANAARDSGATVIDPSRWMCTDDSCPVIVGNVLVYNDDSHLSATFSRLVAPILQQRLTAAAK